MKPRRYARWVLLNGGNVPSVSAARRLIRSEVVRLRRLLDADDQHIRNAGKPRHGYKECGCIQHRRNVRRLLSSCEEALRLLEAVR